LDSAIFAIEARCVASRRALHELVGLLGPVLHSPDDDLRHTAVWCLAGIGTTSAAHADILAGLLTNAKAPVGMRVSDATVAARTLIKLADPRWVAPLSAHWSAGQDLDLGLSP
jgi:hypothetical protein